MTVPLISQEIYLLARYSSLDYFGQMRDHFAECVKAAEDALAEFMRHLPPDYRSRPLYQQPDAVWGERVIPNMQWALAGLNDGYIRISHGDLDGLGFAGNVRTVRPSPPSTATTPSTGCRSRTRIGMTRRRGEPAKWSPTLPIRIRVLGVMAP